MVEQALLGELKALLAEEERELLEVIERLTGPGGLQPSLQETDRELSAYDNHPADYGSQLYERSKDLGLLQAAREQLAAVHQAQQAMAAGVYGVCQGCGSTIPPERLLAVPSTLFCVECQREREEKDASDRPVEERALGRPVDRDIAGRLDYGFDQNAAWEEAARHGTSHSRQGNPS